LRNRTIALTMEQIFLHTLPAAPRLPQRPPRPGRAPAAGLPAGSPGVSGCAERAAARLYPAARSLPTAHPLTPFTGVVFARPSPIRLKAPLPLWPRSVSTGEGAGGWGPVAVRPRIPASDSLIPSMLFTLHRLAAIRFDPRSEIRDPRRSKICP
jgi:hypothetical protein